MPEKDSAQIRLHLTDSELMLLSNALNEVCNGSEAIPDWEFHTRMGVDRTEALRLLARVHDLLDTSAR